MTDTQPQPSLNLVVLYVADLPSTRAFYTSIGVKFVEEQHGNGPKHWVAYFGHCILELFPAKSSQTVNDPTRIGFAVDSMNDALSQVDIRCIVTMPCASEWGIRAVICDPDGRRVELIQPPEQCDD